MDIEDIKLEIVTNNEENIHDKDVLTTLSRQGHRHGMQTTKTNKRRVSFPNDDCLVSKSVEPVDPWANASKVTSTEVIKAYMNACARLRVKPVDKLVKQLKEYDLFQSRIDILDLKGVKLDVKSSEALEEIFKRVQVHTLDLENTNLEDEGAIAIIEMIEFYHSAVHICIGYNPRIKTRGWQIFSQMIRKTPFIEFVDVRHCCFNDPCAAVMARSLKLNTTLRILHLEGDNLSGKLLLILCTGIKFNQSISELFLGDNFLVPSDASTLSAMLKSNTTLQLLDIRNNMLQDQGVLHLCDGLSQQKLGIRTLVLWNNQITRSGMTPMANLLAITQNIQTLNIGHNRLGNDGIRNLQIGLLKNRSLLRLGLLNTKITAEGAVALAEYVADTRTLLRLDLRENDLFVGGLMALTLAVKINESVVRIDLDKDLKKEQGMEGTQTSLLVDIYQYLERNKKLGVEQEQLRQQELERQNNDVTSSDDATSGDDVTLGDNINDILSSDVASSDHVPSGQAVVSHNGVTVNDGIESDKVDGEDSRNCENNEAVKEQLGKEMNTDLVENCVVEKTHDGSRFIVSPVRDEKINFHEEDLDDQNGACETSKLFNKENNEEISDPEEFEKELDELLANVSGVKIDLTDLPKQNDNFGIKT